MGISEKQYQAMLKSNDQVAVISDPGKVTIDYGQVQRQAGALGQATAQASTEAM